MKPPWIALLVTFALGLGGGLVACGGDDESTASQTSRKFVRSDSKQTAEMWAVGDGADGRPPSRQLGEQIAREQPDRFLYLGDVYEHGTAEEFERNYAPAYEKLDDVTAPTIGNHEWENREEGYDVYWRSTGRDPSDYYSFKTAGWEIVSLNSEGDYREGSAQMRWLRSALRERGTCRIAFWHDPFQSAGRHGDQRHVEPLWRAVSGHATIVLGGNDHGMQRFRPRDGLVQFVSGAGGRELYEIDRGDPRLAFGEGDHYGALRLDLSPGEARYRFVALGGRTLDSGRIRCRRLSTE